MGTDIAIKSIDEMISFAKTLSSNNLLPSHLKTPGSILLVMKWGMEIGLPMVTALQNVTFINQHLGLTSIALLGLCERQPECMAIVFDAENNDKHAKVTIKKKCKDGEVRDYVGAFTWEDATRAKLVDKDNWKKYPAAMLKWRAVAIAAREAFPGVMAGVYTAEETEEFSSNTKQPSKTPDPTPRNVTPPEAEATQKPVWVLKLAGRLRSLQELSKNTSLGGYEMHIPKLIKKLPRLEEEVARLKVVKLEALIDKDDNQKYVDGIMACKSIDDVNAFVKEYQLPPMDSKKEDIKTIGTGPEEWSDEIEKKISKITNTITKLAEDMDHEDIIYESINTYGQMVDRKEALVLLEKYYKMLSTKKTAQRPEKKK